MILTTKPKAMILSMHSREKRTVKAVLRCLRTVSYAAGAEWYWQGSRGERCTELHHLTTYVQLEPNVTVSNSLNFLHRSINLLVIWSLVISFLAMHVLTSTIAATETPKAVYCDKAKTTSFGSERL